MAETRSVIPDLINQETYIYTCIGTTISKNLQTTIKELLRLKEVVYLTYDSHNLSEEIKLELLSNIENLKDENFIPVDMEMHKKNDFFSRLNEILTSKEIENLRRSYYLYLYGHDYIKDQNIQIVYLQQNLNSAFNIVRFVQLCILQNEAIKNKKSRRPYCLYFTSLHSSIQPLENIKDNISVNYQIHNKGRGPVVPPIIENPRHPDINLSTAVIRLRYNSDLGKEVLKVISKRAEKFFNADKQIQFLMTFKGAKFNPFYNLSMIFLTGQHPIETLIHKDKLSFHPDNVLNQDNNFNLTDCIVNFEQRESNHFKIHSKNYDPTDMNACSEFLTLMGRHIHWILPAVKLMSDAGTVKKLRLIYDDLLKIGLPREIAQFYVPRYDYCMGYSLYDNYHNLCVFSNESECTALLDCIIKEGNSNNLTLIYYLRNRFKNDKANLFKLFVKIDNFIKNSYSLNDLRFETTEEAVYSLWILMIYAMEKNSYKKSIAMISAKIALQIPLPLRTEVLKEIFTHLMRIDAESFNIKRSHWFYLFQFYLLLQAEFIHKNICEEEFNQLNVVFVDYFIKRIDWNLVTDDLFKSWLSSIYNILIHDENIPYHVFANLKLTSFLPQIILGNIEQLIRDYYYYEKNDNVILTGMKSVGISEVQFYCFKIAVAFNIDINSIIPADLYNILSQKVRTGNDDFNRYIYEIIECILNDKVLLDKLIAIDDKNILCVLVKAKILKPKSYIELAFLKNLLFYIKSKRKSEYNFISKTINFFLFRQNNNTVIPSTDLEELICVVNCSPNTFIIHSKSPLIIDIDVTSLTNDDISIIEKLFTMLINPSKIHDLTFKFINPPSAKYIWPPINKSLLNEEMKWDISYFLKKISIVLYPPIFKGVIKAFRKVSHPLSKELIESIFKHEIDFLMKNKLYNAGLIGNIIINFNFFVAEYGNQSFWKEIFPRFLRFAFELNNLEMIETFKTDLAILLSKSSEVRDDYFHILIQENPEAFAALFTDPNLKIDLLHFVDSHGNTLLHSCSSEISFDLSLNLTPDVNIKNEDGNTALHFAMAEGNVKKINYLLAHGADQTIKNNNNETPWDVPSPKALSSVNLYKKYKLHGIVLSSIFPAKIQKAPNCGFVSIDNCKVYLQSRYPKFFNDVNYLPLTYQDYVPFLPRPYKPSASLFSMRMVLGIPGHGAIYNIAHLQKLIEVTGCKSFAVDIHDYMHFKDVVSQAIRLDFPVIVPFCRKRDENTQKFDVSSIHWASILGIMDDTILIAQYGRYYEIDLQDFFDSFFIPQGNFPRSYVTKSKLYGWNYDQNTKLYDSEDPDIYKRYIQKEVDLSNFWRQLVIVHTPDYNQELFNQAQSNKRMRVHK